MDAALEQTYLCASELGCEWLDRTAPGYITFAQRTPFQKP